MDDKIQALATIAENLRAKAVALENSQFAHLLKEEAVAVYHDIAQAFDHIRAIIAPGPTKS